MTIHWSDPTRFGGSDVGKNRDPSAKMIWVTKTPISTPMLLPTPPTMMAEKITSVSAYDHDPGDQVPMNSTSRAPLTPAIAAPSTLTTIRHQVALTPSAAAP